MIGSPQGPSARRPNPPANPLTPANPTPSHLARIAVEHAHAVVDEDLMNLVLGTRFEVVIAENGNDGNAHGGGKVLGQRSRLVRRSVVGQVPGQQKHVGICRDLRQ